MPRREDDYEDDYDDGYDDRYGGVEPHRGTLVLVLGVLSLMACGLLGPVAWAMGSADLKKMRAGRMDDRGESETKAGYICGMIATIMMGIGVLMMAAWFLFVFLLIGVGAAAR